MKIDTVLKSKANAEAQSILQDVTGVTAVVVATVDGFDVASAYLGNVDPSRIAAMASSISAIGVVVSEEARLGRYKCLTVTTEEGFALISPVRNGKTELVINVIANSNAILAQVMYRTAECVKVLEGTTASA